MDEPLAAGHLAVGDAVLPTAALPAPGVAEVVLDAPGVLVGEHLLDVLVLVVLHVYTSVLLGPGLYLESTHKRRTPVQRGVLHRGSIFIWLF